MTSAIDNAGQDLRPPNEALIGPQWLAEHLDDPGLCVIEVDVSPADYSTGHIECHPSGNSPGVVVTEFPR